MVITNLIKNCSSYSNSVGIDIQGAFGCEISGNDAYNNGKGILIREGDDCIISDCRTFNNSDDGVSINQNSINISVVSNIIFNNTAFTENAS